MGKQLARFQILRRTDFSEVDCRLAYIQSEIVFGDICKLLRKGYSIMGAVRGHSAPVIATVCVIFAACLALLSDGVNGQLNSDWVSELGSSRDGRFDLGIESSSATEMCDEGSWGDCGATFEEENENKESHARLLRRIRYYISYGALAANRIPCPPRSGRSYYTRNCYGTTEPVRPYHRSCTAITRCFRDTS